MIDEQPGDLTYVVCRYVKRLIPSAAEPSEAGRVMAVSLAQRGACAARGSRGGRGFREQKGRREMEVRHLRSIKLEGWLL
jgi:hypothetical protein